MAGVIPARSSERLRVLDLCAGPGDVGRAIHAVFPRAEVDAVDRDLFLTCLCRLANQRAGVPGRTLRRDLGDRNWKSDLTGPYDVVAVANALHWFSLERVKALLAEVLGLLQSGGIFLFMEPVSPAPAIAKSFSAWRASQPPQHRWEDWMAFWSRVNDFLGYDHIKALGDRNAPRVGDSLTVVDWIELARDAGFVSIDVLLRDSEKVAIAALKAKTT
jgi:SAM-dependent methyltransferase